MLVCLLFFSVIGEGVAQNIFFSNVAELSFFSEARFENIEALSNGLSGANEVAPVNTAATGDIYAVYNQATKKLSYMINFQGLIPTAMHLHKAAAGANGEVVMAIEGPYTSGMMGTVTLNSAQEADLLAGLLYLNVHTEANPGGEIRAQLVK